MIAEKEVVVHVPSSRRNGSRGLAGHGRVFRLGTAIASEQPWNKILAVAS
jgi:hypothetical protein